MYWSDDFRWAKMVQEARKEKVDKYGEAVVAEWERVVERFPLELANYNNVKHLLFRDGYDEGPPKCETIEEVAERMRKK
jgi:hypothetical protein